MTYFDDCGPTARITSQQGALALLALFLGSTILASQPAFAQSMVDGGIIATAPVGTVTVVPPGFDITPSAGVAGIYFSTDQDAFLFSNTGRYGIYTTNADGIRVSTWGGDIAIEHSGSIEADGGRGVSATADNGAVSIDGVGDIFASQEAIFADPRLGDATVSWSGDLTSDSGKAVVLVAANGASAFSGSGDIQANGDAVTVDSRGYAADAVVEWTGDVTSDAARGMYIYAANGAVSAEGKGAVDAHLQGFYLDARGALGDAVLDWSGDISSATSVAVYMTAHSGATIASGSGTVQGVNGFTLDARGIGGVASLDWDGNITASTGYGISVLSALSMASVEGRGAISAGTTGILVRTTGADASSNASINWTGNITSATDKAAAAYATRGAASVEGEGKVLSYGDALTASAKGGEAIVTWAGSVTSGHGVALKAESSSHDATVDASGSAKGYLDAIQAITTSDADAMVLYSGSVTSTAGKGIYAYSALGSASVEGSGSITAAGEAIHILASSYGTATLSWDGNIAVTGSANAVSLRSTHGDVTSTTTGDILSLAGGIFAENRTNDSNASVDVIHTGNMDVAGTGVVAQSVTGDVTLDVAGDIEAGVNGITADGRGLSTVLVEHEGSITADVNGIQATNLDGAITVHQTGSIRAGNVGISAASLSYSDVFVGQSGSILAYSNAIEAQSIHGTVRVDILNGEVSSTNGHGILAGNLNDEAEVSVNVQGKIAGGADGIHVFTANSDASVSLSMGSVIGSVSGISYQGWGAFSAAISADTGVTGGAAGAGISIADSTLATITNYGSVNNAAGIDAYAIRATEANTVIANYGLIRGSVSLTPWSNSFTNYAGGRIESGAVLDVGVGNYLTNHGTFAPGGDLAISATALTGNLSSASGSVLAYDVDMSRDISDVISVSGTALLQGEVELRFVNLTSVLPAEYILMTADGGVTADDLSFANDFVLAGLSVVDSGHALQLDLYGLDMSPEGLSQRSSIIGDYLNRGLAEGGAGMMDVIALIANANTVDRAETVFDALTPAAALDGVAAASGQSLAFADALMSCPLPSGLNAALREGACDWARIDYSVQDRDAGGWSSETQTLGMSFGVQRPLDGGEWHIGVAGGTSFADTRSSIGGEAESTRFNAGIALKYAPGPAKFAVAFNTSWGDVSSSRRVDLGDGPEVVSGETNVAAYNLRLRGAYLMGTDGLYFLPMIDLNASHVSADAYSESGGAAALSVAGVNDTIFSLSPAIEIGTNLRYADGGVLRAFASVGATFASQSGVDLTSSLASDQTDVAGFTLSSGGDKHRVNLSAGISAFQISGWTADARVGVVLGDTTNDQNFSVKMRKSF